jgi:acyl carrier protein
MPEILETVNRIFQDVVGDTGTVLKPETTAQDVEDWDSLNHIQFIVALEKHYKVRFTSAMIGSWKNVGNICDAIAQLGQR